jgi:hypothetical protein
MSKYINEIGLSVHDKFDELSIQFGQNSCLEDAMEVMVYYPPEQMHNMFPEEVDHRVGPQVVIVRSVAELYILLDEVLAGDYTRFNIKTKEDGDDD